VVERTGQGVEVLATLIREDGSSKTVVCRQGPVLVTAFHPELSGDLRMHSLFLKGC
jgi:5'-phosphate synthase pdxT subunit